MPTVFPQNSGEASADRNRQLMEQQGYFSHTFPLINANAAGAAMVSGTVYYMAIGMLASDIIDGVCFAPTTAGSGYSGVKLVAGLYTNTGVRVASTTDFSGLLSSGTPKIVKSPFVKSTAEPVPTPIVPGSDGGYVAILCVASGTPSLSLAPCVPIAPLAGSSLSQFGIQTGQTVLPATATIDAASGSGLAFWAAIY